MTKRRKQRYRVRNWRDYTAALVRRGSLTLRLDEPSLGAWLDHGRPSRRGRRRRHADCAITCCLLLREVYHLPLRATEGLARSVPALLNVTLPAPDYATLSRRARPLRLSLSPRVGEKLRHLAIDSTGLKLYGEGEWKARLYGLERRRTWRKVHLCVDASTQRVAAALVTEKEVVDPRALPRLPRQIESPVGRVHADGAYDARGCYKAIHQEGARAVIPPRKGSALWAEEYLKDRNSNPRQVRECGAEAWKRRAKCHRRSLAETAAFRIKGLFSDRLRSREVEGQRTEVMVRCVALNRMTQLGVPKSYAA